MKDVQMAAKIRFRGGGDYGTWLCNAQWSTIKSTGTTIVGLILVVIKWNPTEIHDPRIVLPSRHTPQVLLRPDRARTSPVRMVSRVVISPKSRTHYV